MIDNARVSILGGGFYHCTPKWNCDRETGRFVDVYGFLLPVRGGAVIEVAEGKHQISPGYLYFIPGYHLMRQTCEREMDVYWVNFASESYYLHHRLMGIRSVHAWPIAAVSWVQPIFQRMAEFYLPPEKEGSYGPVRDDLPAGLAVQIEGAVMTLTGFLLEATEKGNHHDDHADLDRIRPAIDFMDQHYLRNPTYGEIARQVNLSASYFHRYFKREAGITPFKYMENRRLDYARKLLFDRRLNITEVAEKTGYGSLFYFSTAFRRRFGLSPSHLRRAP